MNHWMDWTKRVQGEDEVFVYVRASKCVCVDSGENIYMYYVFA